MLREEVADHYRERGYTVRERVKVRGSSGHVHALDMVAQGPLGNLAIAIEDAGGFEGPEMHAVKRAAKDIGATPVMAAQRIPEGLRRQAAQAGVVLLDAAALHAVVEETRSMSEELAPPPWPGTEAKEPSAWPDSDARGKSTDPGFWRYPRKEAAPTETVTEVDGPDDADGEAPRATGFGWLPKQPVVAQAPLTSAPDPYRRPYVPSATVASRDDPAAVPRTRASVTTRSPTKTRASTPQVAIRWVWVAVVGGAVAGGTFYALSFIFG